MVIDSEKVKLSPEFGSFPTMAQMEAFPQHKADFEAYLKGKYDYISKFDMVKDEREARMCHHLTIRQAIDIWNKLYK